MKPKNIALLELSLLALFVALFLWWARPTEPTSDLIPVNATTTKAVPFFPLISIEAQSAYVYDVREGKTLYEKNADESRPLASLTKLVSAAVAYKLIPSYLLVRVNADDVREEGDTGLNVDESWNIDNLIDFSLITSSNDGIHAIARAGGEEISSTSTDPIGLFVGKMNAFAKDIGLTHTRFLNPSGLDISPVMSGGYGSARDIAMVVDYILKNSPHLVEATSMPHTTIASEIMNHAAVNTDISIPHIPNLIASKTGFTDLAGGNVVAAFNAGLDHPIIVSVLGSTYDGRFNDLVALVDATLKYIVAKDDMQGAT